jgi:thioredoxin 1
LWYIDSRILSNNYIGEYFIQQIYLFHKRILEWYYMIEVDNKLDLAKQLNNNKQVLVLFYASWCPYCRNLVKIFDKRVEMKRISNALKVNLDDYDNPLWDDYSVCNVPTVMFFEEGQVSKRLDGKAGMGLSEKQLVIWLDDLR